MAKAIIRRAAASRDAGAAIDFYLLEANEKVALGFIEALERAYRLIREQPAVGSSRYAHELGLPNLRNWSLKGYPYVVFYVEREDHIDIWRVLHAASDMSAWLRSIE